MKLFVNLSEYHQEVHHLIGEFFPNEEIEPCEESSADIKVYIDLDNSVLKFFYKDDCYERKIEKFEELKGVFLNSKRNDIKIVLYGILQEIKPTVLPWGSFTGVHPSKIVRRMKELNYPLSKLQIYGISPENIELLEEIYENQKIIKKINGLSLYVNIPFCPSRCTYCSFPTLIADNDKILKEYLDLIEVEMNRLSPYIPTAFDSVYIGGGTPTVLGADLLERLLRIIEEKFDLSSLKEYTVEAGRPETLTFEKLEILKKYNVDRISINPQSMNDKTLKAVGRGHSVLDIKAAFSRAENYDFNINADLIFGLEGEGEDDMRNSLSEIINLNPENITVHTLSIKKGAKYRDLKIDNAEAVKKMVVEAGEILKFKGYNPYYLYRQKNMIGSLENIGYAKPSCQGIYNILMMDELSPILSVGMGAISKFFDEDKIERIADFRQWDVYKERREEKIVEKIEKLKLWRNGNV